MWFHAIPDARVLLSSKGVFHQKPVFRGPNRRLFAQWGSGDSTSAPGVNLVALDLPFKPLPNPLVPESFINGQG
jgi:hypothetical protein